jgi:hypothetical protein
VQQRFAWSAVAKATVAEYRKAIAATASAWGSVAGESPTSGEAICKTGVAVADR